MLPKTFSAYGNDYTIESAKVGVAQYGKTTIECKGSNFTTLPLRDGRPVIPVQCVMIVDGKEYESEGASVSGDGITYNFGEVLIPEKIVLFPADKKDDRTEVPVE